MISVGELGGWPDLSNSRLAVKIEKSEESSRGLDDLVVRMKDAVAMDISIYGPHGRRSFAVSIYHPNKKSIGARKERLCLSAISMSSDQSQTATMSDSVRLAIEPYATLFKHGGSLSFSTKCLLACSWVVSLAARSFSTSIEARAWATRVGIPS